MLTTPTVRPIEAYATLTFRPLTEAEYDGFAGASDEAEIAEKDEFIFILDGDRMTAYSEDAWWLAENVHEWEAM